MNQRPYVCRLPRKQRCNQAQFDAVAKNIKLIVPKWWADRIISQAVNRVNHIARIHGSNIAYGWSGGKDSLALEVVMDKAGIYDCMMVTSRLEYPAFLQWTGANMPDGITMIDRAEINYSWLLDNRRMLFPGTTEIGARWFEIVQRKGQHEYYADFNLDAFIVGRRISDGNFAKWDFVDGGGRVWASPILDWTHEDVLAVCAYYSKPMPPIYDWPRGWSVGTGPWPARQWCGSELQGWQEVARIDRNIVTKAAYDFPLAGEALLCAA